MRNKPKFWDNVRKTPTCWLWVGTEMGGVSGDHYGGFGKRYAHHVSYELRFGPIPEGLNVLHRCDNRKCVRHIYAGTQSENLLDMYRKGRNTQNVNPPLGEDAPNSKISEGTVREIRTQRKRGATYKQLMAFSGLSKRQVGRIVHGQSWTHL